MNGREHRARCPGTCVEVTIVFEVRTGVVTRKRGAGGISFRLKPNRLRGEDKHLMYRAKLETVH